MRAENGVIPGQMCAHGRGDGFLPDSAQVYRVRTGWRLDAPTLRIGSGRSQQVLDGLLVAGGQQYAIVANRLDAAPLLQVLALATLNC